MPSLSLVQELALAATDTAGLWGHSAQTTACFRATSAVPVGVLQPGKAWKTNLDGFSNKSVIPLGEGNGGKYPPRPTRMTLLGSQLGHCHGALSGLATVGLF